MTGDALPLRLVTFWWENPNAKHKGRYEFTKEHVNRLYRGWKRNLTLPFEFLVYVADGMDTDGLDEGIAVSVMPVTWQDQLLRFGRAYCKLGVFSWDVRERFGRCKLLVLDLDMIPVANCDALVRKGYESDFCGYMDTRNPRVYSGSMHMHTAGEFREAWDTFSLVRNIDTTYAELAGSDQMWLTKVLGEDRWPRWTEADGVYDYWRLEARTDLGPDDLPDGACLVMMNGCERDASMPEFYNRHAWIRDNWT